MQVISHRRQPASRWKNLRFLLHDDNYFAGMRDMWSDFRSKLSTRKNFQLLKLPQLRDEVFGFEVLNVPEQTVDSVTVTRRLHRLFHGVLARAGAGNDDVLIGCLYL